MLAIFDETERAKRFCISEMGKGISEVMKTFLMIEAGRTSQVFSFAPSPNAKCSVRVTQKQPFLSA